MSQGIILIAIVLCMSLLARLLISQLFTHRVFNEDSSMPFHRGIIPPPPGTAEQKERTQEPPESFEKSRHKHEKVDRIRKKIDISNNLPEQEEEQMQNKNNIDSTA